MVGRRLSRGDAGKPFPRLAPAFVMPAMTTPAFSLLLLLAAAMLCSCAMQSNQKAPAARLAHDVYFTLNDNSPAMREQLVAACYERLAGLSGIVFFSAGTRTPDLQRDVNDQGYDVSLHVYFADRPSHDAYQTAPPHLQFIAENKTNWKTVRVFDSDLVRR